MRTALKAYRKAVYTIIEVRGVRNILGKTNMLFCVYFQNHLNFSFVIVKTNIFNNPKTFLFLKQVIFCEIYTFQKAMIQSVFKEGLGKYFFNQKRGRTFRDTVPLNGLNLWQSCVGGSCHYVRPQNSSCEDRIQTCVCSEFHETPQSGIPLLYKNYM